MKNKLKDLKSKIKREKPAPQRITNETVAEHREKILAGGRKFKYPLQYSKHKILINAIIVSVAALIGFSVWSWYMLYKNQATGDFFYSMTKILPLSVAEVDGEPVSYNDYLRYVRSDIFYMKNQGKVDLSTEDGESELNHHKRQELDNAEKLAYAKKLARENGISVSSDEVNDELNRSMSAGSDKMTQQDYENNVLRRYLGWSIDEYKQVLHDRILEKKVAFGVDKAAKQKIDSVKQRLDKGDDFATVAREMSDDETTKNNGGGMSASVKDLDSNIFISTAYGLDPGETSGIVKGVDAYYIVKLDSKTDEAVNFLMIKVKLTKFDNDFAQLSKSNEIKEYIQVSDAEQSKS